MVVWSRLYFDLEPYLSEHAGDGATLLAFYHRELAEAAREEYLADEPERRVVNSGLARYFRGVADPNGDGDWQPRARALAELPFHLAESAAAGERGAAEELEALLTQLGYLAARVATGKAYELVAAYELTEPLGPALIEWRGFLEKHAQRLYQHPAMLVGLVNHEGFAAARAQVDDVPHPGVWLRTSPESLPGPEPGLGPEGGDAEAVAAGGIEVAASLSFSSPRVLAVAPDREAGFVLDGLGILRVLDLRAMRETETTLPIRREPLLTLAAAPDGGGLMAVYESAVGELYRCHEGPDGLPSSLEAVTAVECGLPEFEAPVAVWHRRRFWFQAGSGALGSVSLEEPAVVEDPLPGGEAAELAVLVHDTDAGAAVIVLREAHDTLLIAPDGSTLRRSGVEPAAAVACGPARCAVLFSDGELVVYDCGAALTPVCQTRVGVVLGHIGWDGSRLLWLDPEHNVTAWSPGDGSPARLRGAESLFPRGLLKVPLDWLPRPGGGMLAVTTHGVDAFRVAIAKPGGAGVFQELFGGQAWLAVDRRGDEWWLVRGQPSSQVPLARALSGRFFCAVDGRGSFYAANGHGADVVVDLASLDRAPIEGCPLGLNAAAGDRREGCWLVDRAGDIYAVDPAGHCRPAVRCELREPLGARLLDCGDWLVWSGLASATFADVGDEPAPTLLFYRKLSSGAGATLELAGRYVRHPNEGQSSGLWFDDAAGRLVSLWLAPRHEEEPYRLLVAPLEDATAGRFTETPVVGLGNVRCAGGSLSADGAFLGLLTGVGELHCVRVADGRSVAILAGSLPFTSVAAGPRAAEFWLAEAQAQPYHCSVIGGDP